MTSLTSPVAWQLSLSERRTGWSHEGRVMPTRTPAPVRSLAGDDAEPRQRWLALGLLTAVVVLDQSTKWWAWRHAPEALVNGGGTWFIGQPVTGWFSGPVSGPLLDLLNVGLLGLAGFLLVRRRRPALVLVAGALTIAGWGSNLLDRLGLHAVTAPGSLRGAVDFIPLGHPYCNVADFVIVGATALFVVAVVLAVALRLRRGARAAAAGRRSAASARRRPRGARWAVVTAIAFVLALVLTVPDAIGAEGGGVKFSPRTTAVDATRA